MTASRDYLYLYISGANGVMLKVGTGNGDTVAGKVYLNVGVKKQEEVVWVYMRNKLYLRSHSHEPGTIEIICPDSFSRLEMITLHCPDIFNHPQMQVINKNYRLLTDGDKLFVVGKRFGTNEKKSGKQLLEFVLYEFDIENPK